MNERKIELDAKQMAEIELGKLLGQRKAFGLIAGRCSAEHAAALQKIRDEKAYECIAPTWDEFCDKELHMSRAHANRIIRWFEEFGESYFEMAQLTAVSPDEYRTLAPVIVDHRLQINGQSIALIPEKAEEVASAVTEMRRAATAKSPRAANRKRVQWLRRQCERVTAEFEDLSGRLPPEERGELSIILSRTLGKLGTVERGL
jgi:hypothetical protein